LITIDIASAELRSVDPVKTQVLSTNAGCEPTLASILNKSGSLILRIADPVAKIPKIVGVRIGALRFPGFRLGKQVCFTFFLSGPFIKRFGRQLRGLVEFNS